jgi:hypothetical protein
MKTKNMTTPHLRKSISRQPLRWGFLLTPLVAFACFALSPDARAVCQNGCGSNANTFLGDNALIANTTGTDNTATGAGALSSNTTGGLNTATGFQALHSETTAKGNTADGDLALYSNTTADYNTAVGNGALYHDTTGYGNTAMGQQAGGSLTTGYYNTVIGNEAGSNLTTGNYNIDIGNSGVAGDGNTIRIGDSDDQTAIFIAGIYGVNEGGTPLAVYINSSGQLGTVSSSRRFKKDIKPMDQTSQAILALKPVTFHYKSDPSGTAQFGLIAEEAAKVDPDLVVRDAQGEIYTVRYEAVNAMLLNEFLKEHCKVEEQDAAIAKMKTALERQEARIARQNDLETTIAREQKQIEALAAGLQRVSAQLELSKPAPQTALTDR